MTGAAMTIDIAELERLEKLATAGPWLVEAGKGDRPPERRRLFIASFDKKLNAPILVAQLVIRDYDANAALIAAARNALPSLLASAKENERLREELRKHVVHVDPMSWHGELMTCELCEGRWTRAGYKTGVGDKPEKHKPGCLAALKKETP